MIAPATIVAVLLISSVSLDAQVAPAVVKYHATIDNVKYIYGAAEPAARAKSGDVIETNTLDAFGNALQKPGDSLSLVKGDNPLTGPFYIEGAEPGDTLAVKILALDVDSNQGVGTAGPGFGALNATNYTPMIGSAIPDRIWFYPIDRAANVATFNASDSRFSVKIPLHPFFGCIGVAPAGGRGEKLDRARRIWRQHGFSGGQRGKHCLLSGQRSREHCFYLGDGHAAMGDGEIAGTAIEVPLRARLQVSVIKGQKDCVAAIRK